MVQLVKHDIEFILQQIEIAEAHAAATQTSDFEAMIVGTTREEALAQSQLILLGLVPNVTSFQGLRSVDGSLNNLLPGQELFGAQDTVFPRSTDPLFRDGELFDPDGPGPMPAIPTSYTVASDVVDSELRTISNLIVDQTVNNPAANEAAGDNELLTTVNPVTGEEVGLNFIPNAAPDEGLSASFNAWFTFFGQFFDHGLDFIAKGGSGTVFIPLEPDDPLFDPAPGAPNFVILTRASRGEGPDGVAGDDPLTIGVDEGADDEYINTDTPFVDQNQTFGENASHQVFLRAYELNGAGAPVATGKMLNGVGPDGMLFTSDDTGMATWGDLKQQARDILGIELDDFDVGSVPLVAVDQYGSFIPGPGGFPQLVTADPDGIPNSGDETLMVGSIGTPVDATLAVRTSGNFLADIAHDAGPIAGGGPTGPGVVSTPLTADADSVISGGPGGTPPAAGEYDNELLDAHFVTGDGRVNENIVLTTVHHVFHSEHNRLVDETKQVLLGVDDSQQPPGILAQQDGDITLSPLDLLNSFLLTPVVSIAFAQANQGLLEWNGERLFQTAKFGTEMQYQHLVFEEFARKVQPFVNEFDSIDVSIDPSITMEFSQAVYRFGHSMLTETVDRLDPDFASSEVGLITAFLNPGIFQGGGFDVPGGIFTAGGLTPDEAAGAVVRGTTRQVGNEIDEFVSDVLRNNLLGLPLDLATINLARGRDTGVAPLNAVRADFFEQTGLSQLKPYESWVDFALHAKHELSVVNFIAAYGTHDAITLATTVVDKRAAALDLVLGDGDDSDGVDIGGVNYTDRHDFLNSAGTWANGAGMPLDVDGVSTTGLGNIDLWIGGLAEAIQPFSGMLGSTFNFVFENQLESLQEGDRFYYLGRTAGLNFLTELENNSFGSLIERNSDATHLPGDVFSTPNWILEVDQSKQFTGILNPTAPQPEIGASGTFVADPLLAVGGEFTVSFGGGLSLVNAVVVVMINSENEDDPAVARVMSVTGTDFTFRLDEWTLGNASAGTHATEMVSWIAVAAGENYTLPDGTLIKAGFATVDETSSTVNFGGVAFTGAPVVLTQVTGEEGTVLSTLTTRNESVTAAGFDVQIQHDEFVDGLVGAEPAEAVGWIAIEEPAGGSSLFNTGLAVGVTDTPATTVVHGGGFGAPVFLAQMQTQADSDPAAVRGTAFDGSSGTFFIEEDPAPPFPMAPPPPDESTHGPETVGFLALNAGTILGTAPLLNGDPIGDSLFFDLVIRDNPGTVGPDMNYLQYTGGDHVVLGGTPGDDVLIGSIGDDTLIGDAGDDVIEGGDGGDSIKGGDGNDIITDLAGDDVIKGGDGNDAINAGNGDDLVIGGSGADFIMLGQDPGEVFGGTGNDFIFASEMRETPVFGGEGDDWIEANAGIQISSGDNAAFFVDSTIVGNDVFMGGDGPDDFDGESGDDIMIGGGGTDRMEGMIGFDWATFFRDTVGVVADMNIRAFNENALPPSPATIGDRFDQVEALSGSAFADILIGDDADRMEIEATLGVLTNFDLIDGLRGGAPTDIFGAGVMEWGEGNILLGGDGSDILEGRGGDDIIDGDSWLNVQMSAPNESMVPTRYDSMLELHERVFAGELDPGDISIVREILPGSVGFNFDTASYSDNLVGFDPVLGTFLANYDIEGLSVNPVTGALVGTPMDGDGDDYITVTHTNVPALGLGDGSDLVRNTERLQFSDQSVVIPGGVAGASGDANASPMGMPTIDDTTPEVGQLLTASIAGVTDADNVSAGNPTGEITGPVNFTWQEELDPGTGIFTDIPNDGVLGNGGNNAPFVGPTFTVTSLQAGVSLRVKAVYQDANGVLETVFSAPTTQAGGGPVVVATAGDDILNGTNGPDVIDGLAGNDIISGLGGNDTLIGGAGNDFLDGGDGTDTAVFDGDLADFDFVINAEGDLEVVDRNGVIPGGVAGEEDAIVNIEFLEFNDQSVLVSDILPTLGTPGDDTLFVTPFSNIIDGLGGDDTITGSPDADILSGGPGVDTINGLAGDDQIDGGTGSDILNGGDDNDTIDGRAGADIIFGGDGNDTIRGRGGADQITGGGGDDDIRGGAGTDTAFFTGNVGDYLFVDDGGTRVTVDDTVGGRDGTDSLRDVEFLEFSDGTITRAAAQALAVPGIVHIEEETPDGVIDVGEELTANVTYDPDLYGIDVQWEASADGDTGWQAIPGATQSKYKPTASDSGLFLRVAVAYTAIIGDYGSSPETVYSNPTEVPVAGASADSGDPAGDPPSGGAIVGTAGTAGTDVLLGGPGNELIRSFGGDDVVMTGAGNDIAHSGAGNDKLFGGDGNDVLFGGDGDDMIFGEAGDDTMFGEAGNDMIFGEDGNDVIEGGAGDDIIFGQHGNDVLDGGAGADTILGGPGDDVIIGGAGDDIVDGGTDNDLVIATMGDGDDGYTGGEGIDTYNLSGTTADATVDLALGTASSTQTGNDTLDGFENVVGGFGNDSLMASDAVNVLTGGDGDDDFVFRTIDQAGTSEAMRTLITDFQPGDTIDVSAIDASSIDAGNQSFNLVFNTPVFTSAGEIKFRHEQQTDGEHTILEGYVDGDDQADFQIDIAGRHDLTASDFVGVA